jgi:TRAP-type C4-dicarboxylate transport system permease large subunit
MNDVFLGIVPFVGTFMVFITVMIYLPNLALWLPTLMHP